MEKHKIVVIDDEKDICALVQEILEGTGEFTVATANNGEDGIRLCLQEKPRMVFLDFVMPKDKGDKVIATLKSRPETKNIPIVLMSGLGEMIYLHGQEKWKWAPRTKIVESRGEIPEILKQKNFSETVAQELKVAVYMHKPFAKQSLLDVAHQIIEQTASEKETESPDAF